MRRVRSTSSHMMHMNASASQGYMFEAHGHQLCYNNDTTSVEFLTEYSAVHPSSDTRCANNIGG